MSGTVLNLLDRYGCLNPGAWIYVEVEREAALGNLPEAWELLRQNYSGSRCYHLIRYSLTHDSTASQ